MKRKYIVLPSSTKALLALLKKEAKLAGRCVGAQVQHILEERYGIKK